MIARRNIWLVFHDASNEILDDGKDDRAAKRHDATVARHRPRKSLNVNQMYEGAAAWDFEREENPKLGFP
jgi:hypothetical protein